MEVLQKTGTVIEDASERVISTRSLDAIADEPLAALVIDGVRKFRETIPAIIELRKRFSDRPRGHAGIAGCSTWTEFCTRKLGRSIRAVQHALALSNTQKEKQELKEYRLIAAKNVRALEIADELLPLLFQAGDARQHSLLMKYMKL